MREVKTFDNKAVFNNYNSSEDQRLFKKKIFNNEVVWTYLVSQLAAKNPLVFKMVAGFDTNNQYSIYCEGQPLTPYRRIEGNSHIDLALGALRTRRMTESGIEYASNCGKSICFVEAKYLSDLSTKTEHSPVRNQMDRVIENLLVMRDSNSNAFPKETVFTILTPRLFKQIYGSRIYSYRFEEYILKLSSNPLELVKRIELTDDFDEKRDEFKLSSGERFFLNRLKTLKIQWATFEDVFELGIPNLIKGKDVTIEEQAKYVWDTVHAFL